MATTRQPHLRKKYPLTRFQGWLEADLLSEMTVRIICSTTRLVIEETSGGCDPASILEFYQEAKSWKRRQQIIMSWRRWVRFNDETSTGFTPANPFGKGHRGVPLGGAGPLPLAEFKKWLLEVRQVSPRTISAYCTAVRFAMMNTASKGLNVKELETLGQRMKRNPQDALIIAWRRFVEFSKASGDNRYSDPFPRAVGDEYDGVGRHVVNAVPADIVEAIRALANDAKQPTDIIRMRWGFDLTLDTETRLEVFITQPIHDHLDIGARPRTAYVFRLRLQPALKVLRAWGGKGSPYPVVPERPGASDPMDVDRLYRLLQRRHNVTEELALAKKMGEYERAHDRDGKLKSTAELAAETKAREQAAREALAPTTLEKTSEETPEDDLPMRFDL